MTPLARYCGMLAVTTMLAAAPGMAQAQTAEAAIERFATLVGELGIEIDWESADVSGDDAVLVDVTFGAEGETVEVGDIRLSGISEAGNGFRIDTVTVDDYEMDDPETKSTFSISGVRMGGVVLPAEGEENAYGGFLFYETADVGTVTVNVGDTDVFTMADMHFETTAPDGGNPMEFTGAVEGFTIDLSGIEDATQKAVIQALGYEQLEGYIEMAGSWQPTDGRLTLSQYDMTVVDAGTLGLSFDFGGYTSEFIRSLSELQQQMAANPDGDNSQQGLAMLGLMQQLSFQGAEIAFTDDSLTNKVVEFVAQSQGMKPDDIRNQAKAVLPFALAQLNDPAFTTSVTQAVTAFLDDPQVLRITAAPAAPVPFALLMAEGMSTPQTLIKTLAVSVTAND